MIRKRISNKSVLIPLISYANHDDVFQSQCQPLNHFCCCWCCCSCVARCCILCIECQNHKNRKIGLMFITILHEWCISFCGIFEFVCSKTISITFHLLQKSTFRLANSSNIYRTFECKEWSLFNTFSTQTVTFVSLSRHNLLDYGWFSARILCMDKMSSNIYILNENVSFASKALECVWYDQIP